MIVLLTLVVTISSRVESCSDGGAFVETLLLTVLAVGELSSGTKSVFSTGVLSRLIASSATRGLLFAGDWKLAADDVSGSIAAGGA
jgi:hypothetical protein